MSHPNNCKLFLKSPGGQLLCFSTKLAGGRGTLCPFRSPNRMGFAQPQCAMFIDKSELPFEFGGEKEKPPMTAKALLRSGAVGSMPDLVVMSEKVGFPDTVVCEQCGKTAIRVGTGRAYLSMPPQYPMIYKCWCGWTKYAGVDRATSPEDDFKRAWLDANIGFSSDSKETPK